jgi:hypothetical protein
MRMLRVKHLDAIVVVAHHIVLPTLDLPKIFQKKCAHYEE